MHVQTIHQLHAMIFDGLGTDLQDFGNLLGGLALGDQQQNLALPAGQLIHRGLRVNDSI